MTSPGLGYEHARTTLPAEARPQTKSEPPVEGDRTTP